MVTANPLRPAIRFGVFEFDSCAGELRKQGVRIKLQEQPLQILQVLLERPGELVTREELQRKIWPADTFVDFDHGLYNAVKRLREALGDTAGTPRLIETLPKRGYRFIGSLHGNGGVVSFPETSPVKVGIDRRPRRFPFVINISTGIVCVLALFLIFNPAKLRDRVLGGSGLPPIRSLAVLPLQNLSGDAAQEYFADSMTEELITELSGISALKVISHRSTMRYKKSDKPLPELAHELNVDGIVEGSVARSGNHVRITAQLISALQDKNVWARSYESTIQDSLTLQSQVASAIAEEVRAQIAPSEQARLQAQHTVNIKAMEFYLQGNYHFSQYGAGGGLEEAQQAIASYRQAILEDPGFAKAYLKIADVYYREEDLLPTKDVAPLYRAAAEKALALDPNLSDAHVHLGSVKWECDRDWPGAEREFRRAIELNANNSGAHDRLGDYLDGLGRLQEGMTEHQRAQELDPEGANLENAFYRNRQYDQAIEILKKELELAPNNGGGHFMLSYNYAQKGRYEESIRELQRAAILYGYKDFAASLGQVYAKEGYKGAIRYYINAMERNHQPAIRIAEYYTRIGDKEEAFKWLQRAYDSGDCLCWLKSDPHWDPLRSDPRFNDLVRRVGIPE